MGACDKEHRPPALIGLCCLIMVVVFYVPLARSAVTGSSGSGAGTAVTDRAPEEARAAPVDNAAVQELVTRLERLNPFAATFRQVIAGARGEIVEESTGYMLLSRPRFKWVVDDPFPQVIVTDGETLKIYDPDLEQLTLKPLADALDEAPIALLTRPDADLAASFTVVRVAAATAADTAAEGSTAEVESATFVVQPRASDSLFAELHLTFSGETLERLGIVDHLGQYTEICFEPLPGRVIQSADFELEVPPETDVIGG